MEDQKPQKYTAFWVIFHPLIDSQGEKVPGDWGIVIAPNIGRQQGPNNFVAQISKKYLICNASTRIELLRQSKQYTDIQMSIYLKLRSLARKLSF